VTGLTGGVVSPTGTKTNDYDPYVLQFDGEGNVEKSWQGALLLSPTSIAVDACGRIFIAGTLAARDARVVLVRPTAVPP
jgi:hypothetical protein